MFDVGASEMILVVVLAIMLYGGDLPDVARKAGASVRKLRGVADDIKRQVQLPADAEIPRILREADPRPDFKALDPRPDIRALDAPKAPSTESPAPPADALPDAPASSAPPPPPDPPAAA